MMSGTGAYSITRPVRRRAVYTVLLLAVCVACVAAPATGSAGTAPAGDPYVALGDSYSSGEGLPPFLAADAADAASCDRSAAAAYPDLLATDLDLPFSSADFLACSGATTQDLVDSQLTQGGATTPALGPGTQLVTFTIGGNDLDFVPALTACVDGGLLLQLAGIVPHPCWYYAARAQLLLAALAAPDLNNQPIAGVWGIPWIVRAIHAAAPNATIVIGGYPRLFPASSAACLTGTLALGAFPALAAVPVAFSATVVEQFNAMADSLDATLAAIAAAAARTMPVSYANVAPLFTGHAVSCSGTQTAANWINSITTQPAAGGGLEYGVPAPSSFHPTAAGQVAYANAFLAALGH